MWCPHHHWLLVILKWLPTLLCLTEIFTDKNDTEWTNDQELVPIDLNKLSPRSFVAYRFGCFVVRLVAVHCGHKPVSLLIAEKIPVNEKLVRNAYRNSFHYDDLNHILYVREERLGSVGEFMLVIIHALAHIKAGQLWQKLLLIVIAWLFLA